ncbi:MAG: hypothetical protein Q4E57_11525, partial [Eubacteriales bacterium]|nr:hypothetical protein [Eubacteriales bacterium]
IYPCKGLTEKENDELAVRLKEYKDSLSEEEKEQIALETMTLKAYQAEPDEPKILEMLPVLKVSDIDKNAEKVSYEEKDNRIFTKANTRGIAYTKIMFKAEGLSEDEIQFAALLSDIFGEMDTGNLSYSDLYDEVLLNTGGLSFSFEQPAVRNEDKTKYDFVQYFAVDLRTLDSKLPDGLRLASEIINDTILNDAERLTELLYEIRSHLQSKLDTASHTAAALRASSYISSSARFSDLTRGIAYYDFINAACRLTKEPVHMKRFIKSLAAVHDLIFANDSIKYALYGSNAADKSLGSCIPAFEEGLKKAAAVRREKNKAEGNAEVPGRMTAGRMLAPVSQINEGLKSSSQVNYVARCGNFLEAGLEYTGALRVLRVMLNYDYLWINLRVLGGAYGCMSAFGRTGRAYLVSYRDPEISKTNRIFEELPEYLDNWQGDEKTVNKFIIGAISAMDRPMTSADKAAQSVADCFFRTDNAELQKERDEVLSCTSETLRGMAEYIRALLNCKALCTIGNETQIEKEGSIFKSIRDLY